MENSILQRLTAKSREYVVVLISI